MEKEKYELFTEVLKRFDKSGVLSDLIIAGSWNIFLYRDFFGKDFEKIPQLRTTDVDFLVPNPSKIIHKSNIPEIMKDLGFIVKFKGNEGFVKLIHPDLTIEFIVPEKGKGVDNKPVSLPGLGINAPALRFMDILYENIITVVYDGIKVNIAHPAALAFHYLMIYPRRKNKEKAEKNLEHAASILKLMIEKDKQKETRDIFNKLHKNWKKEIIELMKKKDLANIVADLKL